MLPNELLRRIPRVDELITAMSRCDSSLRHPLMLDVARKELEALRASLCGGGNEVPSVEELAERACLRAQQRAAGSLHRVINATGIVLHTNLGRAPLCREAVRKIAEAAAGYSNLEYDLEQGKRGSRGAHLEPLLCELTGAPAALAVNNNAAAILLALSTLAGGGDIVVSRGELVEIGDGFRVPDIMEQSGGRLVAVGATNKTHLRDYEEAITEQTRVLLKVHTSNYRIVGFTGEVPISELVALGRRTGLPVVYDLGSGALLEEPYDPFSGEPTAPQALRDGADLVTFSADKLLGGPQAGILLGSQELIGRMKRSPLARALRIDKLSLAGLEATLRLYRDPEEAFGRIPALKMLTVGQTALRERAESLCVQLREQQVAAELSVAAHERCSGGGSAPGRGLPSVAVAVVPHNITVKELELRLRHAHPPIVARISENRLLLDLSTIAENELADVVRGVAQAL